MPGCSFAFCDATRNLHKFPRDPDVRAKWTKFCYRQPDWVPGPGATICREHFTPESYANRVKNLLKKDAVPTLRRGVKRQGSSLEGPHKRTLKPLPEDATPPEDCTRHHSFFGTMTMCSSFQKQLHMLWSLLSLSSTSPQPYVQGMFFLTTTISPGSSR